MSGYKPLIASSPFRDTTSREHAVPSASDDDTKSSSSNFVASLDDNNTSNLSSSTHSTQSDPSLPVWQRIMYKDQPFEDCYVDHTFMSCLRTNEDLDEDPRFLELFFGTFPILQRLASVALWLAIYFLLFKTSSTTEDVIPFPPIHLISESAVKSVLKQFVSTSPSWLSFLLFKLHSYFSSIFLNPWFDCPSRTTSNLGFFATLKTALSTLLPLLPFYASSDDTSSNMDYFSRVPPAVHSFICEAKALVSAISISESVIWYFIFLMACVSFLGFLTSAKLSKQPSPERHVFQSNTVNSKSSNSLEKILRDPKTGMVDLGVKVRKSRTTGANDESPVVSRREDEGEYVYDPSDLRIALFDRSEMTRVISRSYSRVLTFLFLYVLTLPFATWLRMIPDGKFFALVTIGTAIHLFFHDYLPISFKSQYEIVEKDVASAEKPRVKMPFESVESVESVESLDISFPDTKKYTGVAVIADASPRFENNEEESESSDSHVPTRGPKDISGIIRSKSANFVDESQKQLATLSYTNKKSLNSPNRKVRQGKSRVVVNDLAPKRKHTNTSWLRISANILRDANTLFCEGSTYAIIAASLLLSSRLEAVSLSSSFFTFSVVLFSLVPVALSIIRVRVPFFYNFLTFLLLIGGWVTITATAPILGRIFVASIVFVACIAPQCLVFISRQKRVYHGPWDYYEEGEIGAENI